MNRRMPKGKRYKLFQGVQARPIFLKEEDERTVLDLIGRFSGAVRSAYKRLLRGRDRKELKREDGPLCVLFDLNTRYADGAIEKAQAPIASSEEFGNDPRKVTSVYTKESGVLGIDINSDLYQLALAVVSPDGNLRRHLALSPEEVDQAPDKGTKELLLWRVAHQVVVIVEECGVAIATERLKYLRKSRRGDGSGRRFRRNQHRFVYRSLLERIHSLARKRGVEVIEVNPQDTSTIGMLKYAPQLHLSKDGASALVISRRALGFEEKLPKSYKVLLKNDTFYANARGFYQSRPQEMQKVKEAEKNPYLKRRLLREIGKARKALFLLSSFPSRRGQKASLQGSPGSRKGSTGGRNPSGTHPWRVLRVGTFLPLLGVEVPRDLSRLEPILDFTLLSKGSWEGWKVGLGPHPDGGRGCASVCFE